MSHPCLNRVLSQMHLYPVTPEEAGPVVVA